MSNMIMGYPLPTYEMGRIDELAYRLKTMSGDMELLISTGRECWRGEAANAYYESCVVVGGRIGEASEEMREFSIAMLNAAKRMIPR